MNTPYTLRFASAVALTFSIAAVCLGAQNEQPELKQLRGDLAQLEKKVDALEIQETETKNRLQQLIEESGGTGIVLFLFGGFCALWAQNTGRNPWLWFFLGLFFGFITVLFLLSKNSQDIRDKLEPPKF